MNAKMGWLAAFATAAACTGGRFGGGDGDGQDDEPEPVDCDCEDDGIACTAELCDEAGQCVHRADDRACAGGGACEIAACDVEEGGCVLRPRSSGVLCGPHAPNGGSPEGCFQGECVPGKVVGLDPFGTLSIPDVASASPDGFTVQLARVDDRNGDGGDDLAAMSVPLDNYSPEPVPGSVTLFSPISGEILWTATGSADNVNFGYRLMRIGDLGGDGLSDLLCTEQVLGVLAVVALDATNGAPLWRHEEPEAGYLRIATSSDLDGDGVEDVIVAAGVGLAILSGTTGDILRATAGAYGPNIGSGPDVDGDGKDDIVSDAQPSLYRYVRVVSSETFETLQTFEASEQHVWFSGRTADLDGSGFDEVLITRSDGYDRTREAQDLVTGAVVWEQEDPRSQPITTFDLDGDSIPDLLTDGRLQRSRWRTVLAISGADGSEIFNFEPQDTEGTLAPIDTDITQIGDLDGDGTDDFAIGDEVAGSRVFLYSTQILYY